MQGLVFEKLEGPLGMGLDDTLGELEGVGGMVWELEGVDNFLTSFLISKMR